MLALAFIAAILAFGLGLFVGYSAGLVSSPRGRVDHAYRIGTYPPVAPGVCEVPDCQFCRSAR